MRKSTKARAARAAYLTKNDTLYAIPYFGRYCITKSGEVVDTKTLRTLNVFKMRGDGGNVYDYVNVYCPDKAQWRGLPIHRLLALTFIPQEICVDYERAKESGRRLVVAHLDGNPRNNALENLYWVMDKTSHTKPGCREKASKSVKKAMEKKEVYANLVSGQRLRRYKENLTKTIMNARQEMEA